MCRSETRADRKLWTSRITEVARPMDKEVKVWQISLIGLIAVVVVVIVVLLLQVLYVRSAERLAQQDLLQPPAELSRLTADQQARLLEYRIIDPENNIVSIPIDLAQQLVLRELSRSQPAKE